MPGLQKTFDIVPAPVSFQAFQDASHKHLQPQRAAIPPMTTKQVKQRYQKANRGPKISKAEARRIELLEQDRIRKEFEKDKAQARARAAREKKKATKESEKLTKRAQGLPLVSVRPSQDTIARFVRGNGGGRKRDAGGCEVDLGLVRDGNEEECDKENQAPEEQEYHGNPKQETRSLGPPALAASTPRRSPRRGELTAKKSPEQSSQVVFKKPLLPALSSVSPRLTTSVPMRPPTDSPMIPLRDIYQPQPANRLPLPAPGLRASPRVVNPTALLAPSSTQMFLLDNIDELFPSLSQEAFEVSGTSHPPSTAQSRATETTGFPRKSRMTRLPRTLSPRSSVIPRNRTDEPVDYLDIISTQDLVLSSQDIRDISQHTPRRIEGQSPRKPPPILLNSDLSTTKGRTPFSQRLSQQQSQSRHLARAACESCSQWNGSQVKQERDVQETASETPTRPTKPTRQKAGNASEDDVATQFGSEARRQFFTSSGSGAACLLAMEHSHKTFQHEKRKREEVAKLDSIDESDLFDPDDDTLVELAAVTDEALRQGDESAPKSTQSFGDLDDETLLEAVEGLNQSPLSTRLHGSREDNAAVGKRKLALSQETDYGDLDFDLDIELLEA